MNGSAGILPSSKKQLAKTISGELLLSYKKVSADRAAGLVASIAPTRRSVLRSKVSLVDAKRIAKLIAPVLLPLAHLRDLLSLSNYNFLG